MPKPLVYWQHQFIPRNIGTYARTCRELSFPVWIRFNSFKSSVTV
ncbi:hypothetical protein BH11PSE11_BH11PSE11_22230 [soil metagenome]